LGLPALLTGEADAALALVITAPPSQYSFTAGQYLHINIDSAGSTTDLVSVSLYADATLIDSSNELPFPLVWTNVPPGIYSLVAVALSADGSFSTSAPVAIQAIPAPLNDDWQNATVIEGTNVFFTGTLLGATSQPFEDPNSFPGRNSIWWRWTAPISANVTLTSGGNTAQIELAVTETPDSMQSRQEILGVYSTNSPYAVLTFAAREGVTYWISAFDPGWFFHNSPEFPVIPRSVTLQLRLANLPPGGDLDHAIALSGALVATNFTNVEAVQPPAPLHNLFGPYSTPMVWFTWRPPTNGFYGLAVPDGATYVFAAPEGTNFSQILVRYSSNSLVFAASADLSYYFAWQTSYSIGEYSLRLEPFPAQPNDEFANRIPVSGSNVLLQANFLGASADPGQPPGWETRFGGRGLPPPAVVAV